MDPLELACMRLSAGVQVTEELPWIAADALARGLDSPYLRRAAGATASDVREARDLFVEALGELGYTLVDEQPALWQVIRETCRQIVSGDVEAYAGARQIWSWSHRFEKEGDLRTFVGLASEWEDHPAHRSELEGRIGLSAERLLARAIPRTWVRLTAQRGRWPVWNSSPLRNLDPATLPISTQLTKELTSWAAEFDGALNRNDFRTGGFESVADLESFVSWGAILVGRLQADLGDDWHVEYSPAPIRPAR
jgi:hypothetical protein